MYANTKKELAEYLALTAAEQVEQNGARMVVAYGCECKGNKKDMSYLKSDQEEAYTKIVLHALDASQSMEQRKSGYIPRFSEAIS